MILLVLAGIWPLLAGLFLSGDYVHLALMYPAYASRIRAAEAQHGQASFAWGGTGFAGIASSERALVYDATGQLAREVGVRPYPHEAGVWTSTNHLVGKFYIVVLSFGGLAAESGPASIPKPSKPPDVRLHPGTL